MKALRKWVAVLLMMLVSGTMNAQKTMDVSRFMRLDNDLMARVTKPVYDHDEGRLCALIRVVTNLTEVEVRADALGIVQQESHNGEIWLYVPYGAKQISFMHNGYFPLLYHYDLPIEDGTVYELRLTSFETSNQDAKQNSNTQMFVLTHNPDDATVFIDDMEVPSENGVFAAMMSKGEHTYRVKANQYEEVENTFVLEDQPLRENVKLDPLFGKFNLYTLPDNDFSVFLDGAYLGRTPYQSDKLTSGSYRLHVEKKNYYPIDTLLRLREGDEVNLTLKLTSFTDSLFYNRRLGGRKVSFGVNGGYLMPFVASKASGSFTGSLINYSLGNELENVYYRPQGGFSIGIFADIRLYKNLYLQTGLNYLQLKYSNVFDSPISNAVVDVRGSEVYQGDMQNKYKEVCSFGFIDFPILASYRFVLTKTGSLHFSLGPFFSYGLSAEMKLSGSTDASGNVYVKTGSNVDYDHPVGTFLLTNHADLKFNLYRKSASLVTTYESAIDLEHPQVYDYSFDDAPYKKLNYGLRIGTVYELRGFQLGIQFSYQLSNMANDRYWESTRFPLFQRRPGDNNMSGYKHHLHSLEIKLGYVFRYL